MATSASAADLTKDEPAEVQGIDNMAIMDDQPITSKADKKMDQHDLSSDSLLHLPQPNSPNSSATVQIEMGDYGNDKPHKAPAAKRNILAQYQDNDQWQRFSPLFKTHGRTIMVAILDFIIILYSIVGIAHVGFEKAVGLFIIGIVVFVCLTWMVIQDTCGTEIYNWLCQPVIDLINLHWKYVKWFVYCLLIVAILIFLIVDTRKKPIRFLSLLGLVIYIFIAYVFSRHRRKVIWRPVVWGLALQFIFGLLILRTTAGYEFFKIVGDQISIFLDYTDVGAKFVFGNDFTRHYFAFKVLSIIVFFSSAISVLYYIRIMPIVIRKIAWVMHATMKTSGSESLSAAGNIFVGQTEAPLLVKPFLKTMTMSELHAVMTGGFATIAGGVLAAYISFGVPASHLLSASVMSAPAALAISKLMYPETEESQTKSSDDIEIEPMKETNVIEAAASGASQSIALVANIAANLIAFLAFLAFIDAILSYLGSMVDHPEVSFKFICSWLLRPFAFIMGVDWEDCGKVGELLGIKTFANEFIAYDDLSKMIKNQEISERSEIIATYALCGFSNFGSMGIQIGGLGPLAPNRKADLAQLAFRALIAGTIACFMTACVAGILL